MDDLGVVGILGPENFEQQKSCEAEFVKEIRYVRDIIFHKYEQ